jgi:hypothetical protein
MVKVRFEEQRGALGAGGGWSLCNYHRYSSSFFLIRRIKPEARSSEADELSSFVPNHPCQCVQAAIHQLQVAIRASELTARESSKGRTFAQPRLRSKGKQSREKS